MWIDSCVVSSDLRTVKVSCGEGLTLFQLGIGQCNM